MQLFCIPRLSKTNLYIHSSGKQKFPEKPDYSMGYVWNLYPDYDVFLTGLKIKSLEQLTSSPGCDAEATVAFNGSKVV